MTKLTKSERDDLPDSAFALPNRRYPIHDAAHARDALARAAQMHKKGFLSQAEYAIVVKKAHAVIERDEKEKT